MPLFGRRRLSAAERLSRSRLGFTTRLTEKEVIVGTSVVELMENNSNRLFWELVNRGVSAAFFSSKRDLTSTNARPLGPNGGFATAHVIDDGDVVTWAQYAIADFAGQSVHVTEIIAIGEEG